jgi:hypothetical protein
VIESIVEGHNGLNPFGDTLQAQYDKQFCFGLQTHQLHTIDDQGSNLANEAKFNCSSRRTTQ